MKKIALIGNPNVGKSTDFNALTDLHQHTGNWAGKTVTNTSGDFKYNNENYTIYDLPGTYSLIAHSKEEEVARDFICFGDYEKAIVVCDAVCLERNLNLVLQSIEVSSNVVVCVNLIDEAQKKNIYVDLNKLENILGVPVVGTSARNGEGLDDLLSSLEKTNFNPLKLEYSSKIEDLIECIIPYLENKTKDLNPRWVAINLINYNDSLYSSMTSYLELDLLNDENLKKQIMLCRSYFEGDINDEIVNSIVKKSEEIANEVLTFKNTDYNKQDRKIDKVLTSKLMGIPIMVLLVIVIFWITINGANYPSELLFNLFSKLEMQLYNLFNYFNAPNWITGLFVSGIYKVLSWVIAVMLPPMAIFFPLFTILEDLGYLPRIAFNLDRLFKKCKACGKQALTMCMGFGCNAVGVSGARIIDSPRERLIAILTNVFVPCNGRFPTMITIITIFFIGINNKLGSLYSVLLLTLVILLGILLTFVVSHLLSRTLLKGIPSSFILELPPYRKPQVGKVIIRSIFDRTLFVLSRAIIVAAPAGAIIWILANFNVEGVSLLSYLANFLNPFASLIGLDGVILLAFILGFPANEIVIPIMLMTYMSTGHLVEFESLSSLKDLLVANGWTIKTAICTIIFSLCHFPCSTTCLTIKKETNSFKWMILSILIPTVVGITICFLINLLFNIF